MRDYDSTRQAWLILSACAALTLTAVVLVAPKLWLVATDMIAEIFAGDRSEVLSSAERSGHPGYWVTDEDYPLGAILRGEQGRVGVTIHFDGYGIPTACRLVTRSDSETLNKATCRLVMARGRIKPTGEDTTKTLHFRWVLPN